ncbi:MAG: NfeD family protein [Euryarchaeota archaeon]|nr:NfeD family protein [Euryarchaeota archaeon]
MDLLTLGILFVVIGLLLLIGEVHTPGFFIAVPGTILVVLGIAMIFMGNYLDILTASVLVLVSAVGASAVTLAWYKSMGKTQPPSTTTVDGLVGKTGIVTVRVEPNSIKGKVKIDNDIWSATAEQVIEEGKKVVVVKGEGVHVVVREVK